LPYTLAQKSRILQKIIAKANALLLAAEDDAAVDEVMRTFGVSFEEGAMPVDPQRSKILVFGALAGSLKDYQLAAKKLGIPSENIVFESDYERLHNYDTARLRFNSDFSDIVFGPVPHKQENMGNTSSLLAEIKRCPNEYPRLTVASANGTLKLTITSFRNALSQTRYFESKA